MTDFCISSPDRETMVAGWQAVGIADEDGNIRTQGIIAGAEWVMLDVGARRWIEGEGDETAQTDGLYWVIMRWNGGADLPMVPPGITLAWRSDDENAGEYPSGLPRFA